MNEKKKDIKVVTGDGSNLDISPVYDHFSAEKPQTSNKKPKDIVIPKVKKGEKEEKKEEEN